MQYSLWVLIDLNGLVASTYLHLVPQHNLQEPLFFSRGATFSLTRISFKRLALLKPTIGILSKTFPCSLSGVNSKRISESTLLSFDWMISNIKSEPTVISYSLSFAYFFSGLQNFVALLTICLLTTFSLQSHSFCHTSGISRKKNT